MNVRTRGLNKKQCLASQVEPLILFGCSPWVCPQFITDKKDYLNVLFTDVMNYNKQKMKYDIINHLGRMITNSIKLIEK